MALRQRLIQAQLHLQKTDEFNPDDYIWMSLGWARIGVSNEEGYSKEFISIGTEKGTGSTGRNLFRIDAVEIAEKFYYSNADTPHHTDYTYYDWTGNLVDYVNITRREKRFA